MHAAVAAFQYVLDRCVCGVIKETKRGKMSEWLWKSGCRAKSMDLALHGVYHRVLLARKKDARLFGGG